MRASAAKADIASGLLVTGIGLVTLQASFKIPRLAGQVINSRTFPYILGFLMLGIGLALIAAGWRARQEGAMIDWPEADGVRRLLAVMLSLGVYIACLELVGFELATFGYLSFTIWFLARYRLLICCLASAAVTVVSRLLFINLLGLNLPTFPLL